MAATIRPEPTRRRGRRALRVVEGVLVTLVVLLAFVALSLAFLVRPDAQGVDAIFGHPIFNVASGSMTPAIDTGDLIVDNPVSSTQAAALHVGQIISFRESATGASSLVVTHRIVAVLPGSSSSGAVLYRTKGDANNAPDLSAVAPSQVLGVYSARVPFGAYVLSTLHRPLTFVILIMIPVVYLAEEEVRRRWIALGIKDAERRRAKAERDTELESHGQV
jgi:signal peptidase